MALRANTTLNQFGAAFAEGYHRVSSIVLDAGNNRAVISVLVYVDQAARDGGAEPIARLTFEREVQNFTNVPADPFDWVYTHLKTLGEYAGAVDV